MERKSFQIPFFIICFLILLFSFYPQKENSQLKEKIKIFETYEESIIIKDIDLEIQENCLLNFNEIYQYPQLPTGCEITSLAMVLNYYGQNIDKIQLLNYMPMGVYGEDSFYNTFIGSPYSSHGFGCYVQALIQTLKNYSNQYNYLNLTGSTLRELQPYIAKGYPIIVWATIDMMNGYQSQSWQVNGETITWITNEHCLVLIGYDNQRNVFITADPLRGLIQYDSSLLESRYNLLGNQALLIERR